MKKILTVLTITTIAMTSIFAKSAQVQLVNTIEETPVSYELAYAGDILADGIDEYSILVAPLTENGETKDFTVKSTSNMNSDLGVEVVITPDSFRTTLNDGADNFNSEITPSVNTTVNLKTIAAGKHIALLVNQFNLSWNGNADLPAGDYVSNVKIEYTIK
jgi:hypothetical protein